MQVPAQLVGNGAADVPGNGDVDRDNAGFGLAMVDKAVHEDEFAGTEVPVSAVE